MGRLLFHLYLAKGIDASLFFLSSIPSFDRFLLKKRGYQFFDLLTPPLPLGAAARVYDELRKKISHSKSTADGLVSAKMARDYCRDLLYKLGLNDFGAFNEDLAAVEDSPLPNCDEFQDIERLLKGRLLSLQEILRFTGSASQDFLTRILQNLCLERRVVLLPALYPVKGNLVCCQRCGWEGIPDSHPCARCGSETCCSCPECGLLGNLCFCDQLYTAFDRSAVKELVPSGGLRRMLKWNNNVRREIFCSPLVLGASSGGLSAMRVDARPRAVSSENGNRWRNQERSWKGSFCQPGGSNKGLLAGSDSRPMRYESLLGGIRLTPSQESAADTLLKFGREGKPEGRCLVWAACGAGKTEVSFPLIAETLRCGQKVLFVSPRRDVVLEIAPRMAKVFGEGRVNALYGGSGSHRKDVPLVVATTHQTLRFYRKFDLVILDEGDAFPFPGSRMLHFGVERARGLSGKLVYLTATPASWMFKRASKMEIITIPVRPHGFPLPIPKFLQVSPLKTVGKGLIIHQRVLETIAELLKKPGARIFIFVPSVALTSLVGEALRSAAGKAPLEHLDSKGVEWIHASDRDRNLKRERFFAGEFPVLVTTTIMERGVTVPRVHVLVLEAEQEGVFDTPTLVQIAGRCGRSPEYPTGEVWFISAGISRSMRETRMQIAGLNKEAMRKGYLRDDWEKELSKF